MTNFDEQLVVEPTTHVPEISQTRKITSEHSSTCVSAVFRRSITSHTRFFIILLSFVFVFIFVSISLRAC